MHLIDSPLKDLLVREAHLRLSREQLMPVWAQKEAELRAIQTARPAFWPVFSRRKRSDYEAKLGTIQQIVDVLRQGVNVLDRIEPEIKKQITEELENILRADHPEYVEALAALRQKDDWMRCIDRLEDRINGFASQLAGRAFQLAIDAAQKLEGEVVSANKMAEARARIFIANGFKSRPLPKLESTGFAAWVAKISVLPRAEVQPQIDLLAGKAKKLAEVGLRDLRSHAHAINEQQTGEVQGSLYAVWEKFRLQVAPEIYPGDTERVVEETELLLFKNGGGVVGDQAMAGATGCTPVDAVWTDGNPPSGNGDWFARGRGPVAVQGV